MVEEAGAEEELSACGEPRLAPVDDELRALLLAEIEVIDDLVEVGAGYEWVEIDG